MIILIIKIGFAILALMFLMTVYAISQIHFMEQANQAIEEEKRRRETMDK